MSKELEEIAKKIRYHIVDMTGAANSGHPGGSLSSADIITALYFKEMNIDPKKPNDPDRDRFVLSKGHGCPALYAALALKGFFPVEDLKTLRQIGSHLQGHPHYGETPGVEASTGSLGQGLSIASGMALAGKLDKKEYYVYALLGDGECQEGQVWEAVMAAAHFRSDNLIAFVDYNGLQIDGSVEDVMNVGPLAEKWRSFGWHVQEIDGHDFDEIFAAIKNAKAEKGKPSAIIAKTVKGKGVSFMEGKAEWHGKAAKGEELGKAKGELG